VAASNPSLQARKPMMRMMVMRMTVIVIQSQKKRRLTMSSVKS